MAYKKQEDDMCTPASFVLTKNKIFWSRNSDSHEDIIEENRLYCDGSNGPNILRVEITPKEKNWLLPLEQWKYKIDQDIFPKWYNAQDCEKRTRKALVEWAKQKIKTTIYQNSGDWNSGVWNSGDSNSGDWNSGDSNSGDWNSGHSNSGHRNSGDWNSGVWNSGDRNSGDWNSGDWNSGHRNSGVFCTTEPKIKIFDVDTKLTLSEWRQTKAAQLLSQMILTTWVLERDMTELEKTNYPEAHVLGGYLKTFKFKEACEIMWKKFTLEEKKIIKQIPNFNAEKFEQITGIKAK